jgi:hypothetical protein
VGNRLLRRRHQAGQEGRQKRCTRPARAVPLSKQPGLEIGLIGQLHPLEEIAAKGGRKLEQPFGGQRVGPSHQLSPDPGEIDRDFGGVK